MSTQIAIGFSAGPIISDAVTQAALAVRNKLKRNPDLAFVLACPSHINGECLGIVHNVLKPTRLTGTSTSGIMLAEGIFHRGIAILGIVSTEISFGVACSAPVPAADARQAGVDWANRITADAQSQRHEGCLLFADHRNPLDPAFLLGVQEILGNSSPLCGALASDDLKFQGTSLFFQKQTLNQGIVGLLLNASKVALGNAHGFKPLGKPRMITRAERNVIVSIDNQPAVNLYREFLKKEAETLSRGPFSIHAALYPLGIYLETHRQYLVKNAVDITIEGSIVVAGDVPPEAEVHLMIGNKDSCRSSMQDAVNQVKSSLGGRQAKLIIVIESCGRQKILKSSAGAQLVAIREALGFTTPVIGMYSFGELTPLRGPNSNHMQLQNGSITIIAIE